MIDQVTKFIKIFESNNWHTGNSYLSSGYSFAEKNGLTVVLRDYDPIDNCNNILLVEFGRKIAFYLFDSDVFKMNSVLQDIIDHPTIGYWQAYKHNKEIEECLNGLD